LDSEDSEKQQKKNKAIIDFSPLKNQERKQSGFAEFAFMMIDYIYIRYEHTNILLCTSGKQVT